MYISVSAVNPKLELIHPVDHMRASELFLVGENGLRLLNRGIKICVSFGIGLVVQFKISFVHFCLCNI